MQALTADEEMAERMAERMDDLAAPPRGPQRRMADWSPSVELLTSVNDRLGELIQVCAMLGGAKPRQLTRGPYPVTAADRVRRRRRIEQHESLVARMLPHKANQATG